MLDNWYDLRINESKMTEKGLKVCGDLVLSFIVKDEDGNVSYLEKKAEFEHLTELGNASGDISADPKVMVKQLAYNLADANTVEARAELSVTTPVYENDEITVVTDIKICDTKPANDNGDTAMVVYFGEEGESLWDIARRYLSGAEDIKKLNGIDEDVLSKSTTLLIPVT